MHKPKTTSFFREFLKKGKMVGSVHPSSKYLIRKMLANIDFEKAKCIVELGPGDGCITRELLRRMGPDTQLFAFEMSERFVRDFLHFDDPRVHIIHDSAEFIGKHLAANGITQVDYIVSSLPLSLFPLPLKEKIVSESIKHLRPGGIYKQYQYSTSALRLLKSRFRKVKLDYTPFNIPPAFVYTCFA